MGISQSTTKRRNKTINKQLKHDEKRLSREVKILLLGAGDSGKSTILKQMRLIHTQGFNDTEREAFRVVIFGNIVSAMQALLDGMHSANLSLLDAANHVHEELLDQPVPRLGSRQPFLREYLCPLKCLWADPSIQQAFAMGNTFALNDNVA